TWPREILKGTSLARQIASCKILAPADGLVLYAKDPGRYGPPQIKEGAVVRERQKILSFPDLSRMRVNVKVPEPLMDRLRKSRRARIRVDAFPDQVLTGSVIDVALLPDPNRFFSSDVKVYTTHVSIDKGIPGLRLRMTALVEILDIQLEDVL